MGAGSGFWKDNLRRWYVISRNTKTFGVQKSSDTLLCKCAWLKWIITVEKDKKHIPLIYFAIVQTERLFYVIIETSRQGQTVQCDVVFTMVLERTDLRKVDNHLST